MRAERGWVTVHPEFRAELESLGLFAPSRLVDLSGEVVSGHPDRHVRRSVLGNGRVAFLKREHRIPWRERFKNRQAGFGWASKSAREAKLLIAMEERGLRHGPRWMAFGENGRGQAFLLLAEAKGVQLRDYWRTASAEDRHRAAEALGRWVSDLHAAGVDQPDLFAKHILLSRSDCLALDWQRAVTGRTVSEASRLRAIAVLNATLPEAASRERAAFLVGYFGGIPDRPVLRELRRLTVEMLGRRSIRRQNEPVTPGPRFVWLDGEALCAVPGMVNDFRVTEFREAVQRPPPGDLSESVIRLPSGEVAFLRRRRFGWPWSRAEAKLRGRNWRSPELRAARELVERRRAGESVLEVLAFGQRLSRWGGGSFLLTGSGSREK